MVRAPPADRESRSTTELGQGYGELRADYKPILMIDGSSGVASISAHGDRPPWESWNLEGYFRGTPITHVACTGDAEMLEVRSEFA